MNSQEIKHIVDEQRKYFRSGKTLSIQSRINALKQLKQAILKYQDEINEAIKKDLGKSEFESYMCEVGLSLSEISHMLKYIRSYAKEKKVHTPLAQFHSRSFIKPSPRGVVLIMSPWNYPFLLTIEPLIDALSAGNTAILKPSAYSPYTSLIIEKIIKECFDERLVCVVTGGRNENNCLLNEHFDYIFFTGSQAVGKEVMRHAANYLTPVTLELGGKSPCIITDSANIKLAAKRVVFGKYLNCGQTCVAPDYILCHSSVKDAFISEVKAQIAKQFGSNALENPDYGKIINQKHFDRLMSLIDHSKVISGGKANPDTLQIEPAVMDNVTFEDACMQEEIFGPIMPVISYDSIESIISIINDRPHPLALYIFTKNRNEAENVLSNCGFGGGCINDTIIHLATSQMGFGGFGESGMGSYHGKNGFDTFSHYKSIVDKKCWIDLPMRYHPYRKSNDKLIHMFLK